MASQLLAYNIKLIMTEQSIGYDKIGYCDSSMEDFTSSWSVLTGSTLLQLTMTSQFYNRASCIVVYTIQLTISAPCFCNCTVVIYKRKINHHLITVDVWTHKGLYDFTSHYDITMVGLWYQINSLCHQNIFMVIQRFIPSKLNMMAQWLASEINWIYVITMACLWYCNDGLPHDCITILLWQ